MSGDTREEYPWEFPEFEQYKNPDFVFDYNGTPVIYAFWTAGHKENFQNNFFITDRRVLNPYWQILENSSRNLSEISVFRDVTQTDFWKTRPKFPFPGQGPISGKFIHHFLSTYTVFVKYRGMS